MIRNLIPPFAVFSDCGEGQETADTYKACQPFLPLSRLFCSAVLRLQNVLTEPLKKSVLNWAGTHIANYCIRITNPYRSHPVSQSYPPVFFHTLYDIFENLIGFHHFC